MASTTLTNAQKAVASVVEECTGWSIAKRYDHQEQVYGFALLDPCGDQDGDLWHCWKDLLLYCLNNDDIENQLAAEGLI